ncbi:MAG: hypothetical protein P4L92_11025 [Rudaea sp.]|nr:hypothetical protein [Rudaea sp.]
MFRRSIMFAAMVATSFVALPVSRARAESADLECKLKFSLTEWSAIYKHAEGKGEVTCKNGESVKVAITAVGAGVPIGKFQIDDGTGKFTNVRAIGDVLGGYVSGEADVGVVKSGEFQLLTKGTVSLALAGKGEGITLGVDVSKFTLKAIN